MNTLEIPQKGIYKEYASSWEEISRKDAPYIGELLCGLERQELDVDMFRKLAVDRFINRRNSPNPPMKGSLAWDLWANEGQLAETVNFFFKLTEVKDEDGSMREQCEVIPNFVKNLIPSIRIGLRRYFGPGDFFGEMTFLEFKDLLVCAGQWMKTKDEYWLNRMMGISYRRKRHFLWLLRFLPSYSGRRRIRYVPGALDLRMKKFENVSLGAKYIFFQYVMGCMYMLKTDAEGAGIEIDGNTCSFSLVFSPKKKKNSEDLHDDDQGIGLTGILMALAESGVFGNLESTSNADFWDVLSRLYQLEIQRRELDEKHKKNG